MDSNQPSVGPAREEPFPCWAWYGLGLFADLPEGDRDPFRQWLLRRNDRLTKDEQWPFRRLKLPEGFECHEDIFALRDHLFWEFAVAFRKAKPEPDSSP
jgi:hypothetical protein